MTTSSGTSIASSRHARDHADPAHSTANKSPRSVPDRIMYEQPLNERIRAFLRLEYLFQQAAYHLGRQSEWDSRATLACVLEILEIFGNTNLKSEALKELERHSTNLKRHEQNPDVDHSQLSGLLASTKNSSIIVSSIVSDISSCLVRIMSPITP